MGKLQNDIKKAVTRGCIDKQTATADDVAKEAAFQTVNSFIRQYIETHRKAIGAIISEPYGVSYVFRWNSDVKKMEVLYCLNSEELIKAMQMISLRVDSTGLYEKHEFLCWIGKDNSYSLYTLGGLDEYSLTDNGHDADTYSDGRKLNELTFDDFRFKDA